MAAAPARHLALAAALALAARPAQAQLVINVNGGIDFANAYVDRGVILSTQPVLQPHLAVALPLGSAGGTVGLALTATLEPVSLDSTRYFGMAPGAKSPNLAEGRVGLVLSQPFGPARFAFGALGRIYPNSTGLTKSANLVSFQSALGVPRIPFAPQVTFSYDVGGINGAYFEGELRQPFRIARGVALVIGGRAGWAVSQTADSAVPAFAPYTRDGFTHVEVTAGARLDVAGAQIEPYLAWTRVPDPLTPVAGPSRQRERYLWVGTKISVAGRFPKATDSSARSTTRPPPADTRGAAR
jgi:hypothetical protein